MKQVIYCICGYKNSGKTTTIEKVVKQLTKEGYKVAVIKHDGHDFEADIKDTDTYRAHQAGAYGTAIFSKNRFMVHKEETVKETDLFSFFPEADILLIEGLKHSSYPKYICDYPNEIPNIERIIEQIKGLFD